MGQQQLFLIVIVMIIAGIATIIAIDTMDTSRKNANESAVRQDIFSVLTDARVYYQKSEIFREGPSFDGFTMYHVHSIDSNNENGSYSVSGSGNSVTVEGIGTFEEVFLSATATITAEGMEITWSD